MCLDELGCGETEMWVKTQTPGYAMTRVARSVSPAVTVMKDFPLQAVSNTQCVCSCAWLGESAITKVIAGVSAFGNLFMIISK